MLVVETRSNMTSKYGQFFLKNDTPLEMRRLKLMQIDRMPAVAMTYLAETCSDNSGRYSLHSLI